MNRNLNLKASVTKVIIYITLLVLFYFLYMTKVLNQYASQKTNFAKSTDNVQEKGLKLPALTFCFIPMFKPSMLKHHNISSLFCIDTNQLDETNQFILENANMTWNEFCLNISYTLERDFTLDFSENFEGGTKMKTGINKFGENEVEIREIFTIWDGLCYAMLSNLLLKSKGKSYYFIRMVGFEVFLLILST